MTEYINSLKEDGELDLTIQNILRAYQFEIISKTERGRQYGVDIYAVGKDFEDNNQKKVFLITVKQGDLDRRAWNTEQNSVQQSLDEIRTIFIRNNLAQQHQKLPIKIVVATNGQIRQGVQQSWVGYGDDYPKYQYEFWGIDFLVNHFENKLLNEAAFTSEIRSLVRKVIIYLENPDYDLHEFSILLDLLLVQFRKAKSKKLQLKQLKQIHLVVSIITKYCEESGNLKHAVKCGEKYLLQLWPELSAFDNDRDYIIVLIDIYQTQLNVLHKYASKIAPVTLIKDGFSQGIRDTLNYTALVYEQIGILSLYGLHHIQMSETISNHTDLSEFVQLHQKNARQASDVAISLINHNSIIFSPRSDDQVIEINLLLVLLGKLGRVKDIRAILYEYHGQITEGLAFSNIFPLFSNSKREIAELEIDYEKRVNYKYDSSILLCTLIEWAVVIDNEKLYEGFRKLKEKLLPDLDLILWFPDEDTEKQLYTRNASYETGYSLSGIELRKRFDEFKTITQTDFEFNCKEKEFSFMKTGLWTIGLVASRHFRTYTFPYYWRQFIKHPGQLTESTLDQ